jgi:hypothetical protein
MHGKSVGIFAHGKRSGGNAPRQKHWRFCPWKTLKWKRTAAKALAFSPVENDGVEMHRGESVGVFAR